MTSPRIALLLTGNELMTGDTVDSNSAMMADQLLSAGFQVRYKVTVADELALLSNELIRLAQQYDVIVMNGGLGPTSDDLTADALAAAMAIPLQEHPDALAHLKQWCAARNYPLNAPNRKQAMLPQGASIIPNAIGSAVGFSTRLGQCLVVCTPGVPIELDTMLSQEIVPILNKQYPSPLRPKRHRLRVFGMGESSLQKRLHDAFPNIPDALEIGYRASIPLLELKLKVDQPANYHLLDEWHGNVSRLLGHHIVTEDTRTLAHVVMDLLIKQNKTITFAESCTGGLIASQMTQVSGSSRVFDSGYVTYSNRAKQQMLAVSEADLIAHGAVSETVVREMLTGALNQSGADIGVAVSGIAGPSGGTNEKPVGTVWVAWGSQSNMQAKAFFFPGHRHYFQKIVAAVGLDLARRVLLSSSETPVYFEERVSKPSKRKS